MKAAHKLTYQQGGIHKAPDSQFAVDSVSKSPAEAIVFLEAKLAWPVFPCVICSLYDRQHRIQKL